MIQVEGFVHCAVCMREGEMRVRERQGERGRESSKRASYSLATTVHTLHSLVHASNMLELTESSLHSVAKTMSYLVYPQILECTITDPEVLNLERLFLCV